MAAPKGHKAYKGCETGGRPTKWTTAEIEKKADELFEWLKNPMNIWCKDFCILMGINPDLLSEWAKNNQKFSGAYSLAKCAQESKLVNGGLQNALNANLVKFVLINAHGWVDRNETKVSGDVLNPLAAILTMIDGTSKNLVNEDEE